MRPGSSESEIVRQDNRMLQSKKPMRRVYFNGLTYAVRAASDNILFICARPEGPTIRVERFSKMNQGHTVEDYLTENGYKEVVLSNINSRQM